jgi:hypothetical protein
VALQRAMGAAGDEALGVRLQHDVVELGQASDCHPIFGQLEVSHGTVRAADLNDGEMSAHPLAPLTISGPKHLEIAQRMPVRSSGHSPDLPGYNLSLDSKYCPSARSPSCLPLRGNLRTNDPWRQNVRVETLQLQDRPLTTDTNILDSLTS